MITKSVIYTENTVYNVALLTASGTSQLRFRSHEDVMYFISQAVYGGITEIHLTISQEKEDSDEK